LSVKDTGPGIPENEIPRVLKSFGQGSLAHQTAEGGTGLGLPITKGLTELHEGAFELKSKLRYGTEVIITFPRKRVMEALPRLAEPGEIQPDTPRTAWRAKAGR
jgi:two-component system cell cycle sensor histidine kinase PleC